MGFGKVSFSPIEHLKVDTFRYDMFVTPKEQISTGLEGIGNQENEMLYLLLRHLGQQSTFLLPPSLIAVVHLIHNLTILRIKEAGRDRLWLDGIQEQESITKQTLISVLTKKTFGSHIIPLTQY